MVFMRHLLGRGAYAPPPPLPPPTHTYTHAHTQTVFCVAKRKKGRQRKKRKGFKAKTIKRLSPKSKYYYFNHSRASRIRTFFLSTNHGDRRYFSVLHDPPHFEIHFAGPALI